jgi:AraC-like DNA-binding protein
MEYAKGRGVRPDELLNGSGMDADDLHDHDKLITLDQELSVIKNLVKLIRNPRIGLEIARNTTVSANAHITIPAMFCDTLLDAILLMFKYMELSLSCFRYALTVENNLACLRMKELFPFGDLQKLIFELELASVYSIGKNILGEPLVLKKINIAFPRPEYASFYEELFNCPVSFGADEHMLMFDSFYLYRQLPQANALVREAYEKECKRAHARIREQGSTLEKIRHELLVHGKETPSFPKLAGRLNMSPRTLRRHLTAEKSSYKSLINDFLKNKAMDLLDHTDYSMEKIAEELGYSAASNFCHAFKNWTGHTPSAYRGEKNKSGIGSSA